MESDSKKRKTIKPNRYGESSKNMDDMFDAIKKKTPINTDNNDSDNEKDGDYIASSQSSSDTSNSESVEKTTFKENGSQKSLERQMCRLEAKVNQMHLVVIQIHRACVLNVTSSSLELDRVPELPLKSEEMLNKFELDLSQNAYRQKIVSKWNLNC